MNKLIEVTAAKLEANRLNAQKSTGPRTAKGKTTSKMNAVKYGLFAESVVIHAYKFQESQKDFNQLCKEFYHSLAPVGPVKEALVDRIIMVVWRQRRLRIAESAEIAKAINDAQEPEGSDHTEMLFKMSQNNPAMPRSSGNPSELQNRLQRAQGCARFHRTQLHIGRRGS